MHYRSLFIGSALFASLALPSWAQDAPAPWTAGPLKISGFIDGYYSWNFQNPASGNNNPLRFYDLRSKELSLNMATLYLKTDPAPVGATVTLGFGRGWDAFHATEPGDTVQGRSVVRFLPEAYLSVRPEGWGGFQFDFGKFVTSAVAELTETHLNWNYSRAMFYANGPFYHFGARMTKPVTDKWTVGFHVLNGWNNVQDNNTGKTIGVTSALSGEKASLVNTYYVGPEKAGRNDGFRHYLSNVLLLTPNDKFSAYVDVDFGVDRDTPANGGNKNWWDFGVAGRYQMSPKWAVAGRYEIYDDDDGFITGTAQFLQEATGTIEYKLAKGFLTRFEYRRDWSDKFYFERGNLPGSWKSQNTLLIGFVAYFGE